MNHRDASSTIFLEHGAYLALKKLKYQWAIDLLVKINMQ